MITRLLEKLKHETRNKIMHGMPEHRPGPQRAAPVKNDEKAHCEGACDAYNVEERRVGKLRAELSEGGRRTRDEGCEIGSEEEREEEGERGVYVCAGGGRGAGR